jgi:Putative adhesin
MPQLRPAALTLIALALLAFAATARAESDWQKSYPVSGKPSLAFSTGDSSTEVTSCGQCKEIRIRVQWNDRHPSDYTLTEAQTGDHVNFELHDKNHIHIMMGGGMHHEPHVFIETPSAVDLEGRTSDGSLKVSGLNGGVQLQTSDGSVEVSDVSGAVRLKASDGSIQMHNITGTLESRSSDGSVHIDGLFSGIQVHTSDGSLELTLAEGTKLTTASRVESSDGRVNIHVPRTLAADLEIHTSDGHIQCDLPLVMDGYNSKGDSGHNLRGRINGGGVPLNIHTSDGNVTIASM